MWLEWSEQRGQREGAIRGQQGTGSRRALQAAVRTSAVAQNDTRASVLGVTWSDLGVIFFIYF